MRVRSYGFMNELLVLKSSRSADIYYDMLFKYSNARDNFR